MLLKCPNCRETAYRVYIQVQDPKTKTRSWVPQIGFVWCHSERAVVREEDGRSLPARTDSTVA